MVVLSVKTSFKNLSAERKQKLNGSRCMLLVSVGQEAHECDRLKSTIALLNESFSYCVVLLYDSLQRYTMALNSSQPPETFHKIANQEGVAWLHRNQRFLDQLSMPYEVSRWDTWLAHPHFQSTLMRLREDLSLDGHFCSIFEQTVTQYLQRYTQRIDDKERFDFSRARAICLEYLLEECAVLCLWPELSCQFEVYPNAHNQAMEATREKYVTPDYPHLLRSLSLRFRHAKQLKPQEFRLLEERREVVLMAN